MNDNMNVLIVIAAIAIYIECGVVKAVAYMTAQGMTTNDAFEIIQHYEDYREQAKAGRILGMLPD